eukprot:scpid24627/ scgid20042/ 
MQNNTGELKKTCEVVVPFDGNNHITAPQRRPDYGQYQAKTPVVGVAQVWSLQCAGADQPSCTAPSLLAHLAQHAFFPDFLDDGSLLQLKIGDANLPGCCSFCVLH